MQRSAEEQSAGFTPDFTAIRNLARHFTVRVQYRHTLMYLIQGT